LAKKQRITLIGSLCKGCGYCIEFCPNKVFEKSEEMNEKGVTLPRVRDPDK
jgi:2-oxoglutarate ferredoxin oxidoreductase subunit delta